MGSPSHVFMGSRMCTIYHDITEDRMSKPTSQADVVNEMINADMIDNFDFKATLNLVKHININYGNIIVYYKSHGQHIIDVRGAYRDWAAHGTVDDTRMVCDNLERGLKFVLKNLYTNDHRFNTKNSEQI